MKTIHALLLLLVPAASVQAGPLYDWVYGTPTQYTANYRGYSGRTTANYFPGGSSNTIPGSAANEPRYYQQGVAPVAVQPPAAYAPPVQSAAPTPQFAPAPAAVPAPTGYGGGCNSCQSRSLNYRPPAYRTTTMRVPVTVYRPVTALSPVNGTPVTSYQPCTTYRVQTRRVPTRGWNFPILSWLFGRRQPVYAQPVVANYGACSVNACSPGQTFDGGFSSSGPATTTVQPAQPSWQPAGSAPAAPAQSYVPNSQPPQQFTPPAAPANGGGYQPQGGNQQGGGTAPADRQPSLRPNYDFESQRQETQRQEEEADTDLNGANGTSLYRAPTRRPYYPQPARPVTGQTNSNEAQPQTPAPRVRLRMVPDPDASTTPRGTPEAPQLINPNDRTASQRSRPSSWGVVPVSWPVAPQPVETSKVSRENDTLQEVPRPAKEEKIHWDTSGWQPAGRGW